MTDNGYRKVDLPDRVPPSDLEKEQLLLGCMLWDGDHIEQVLGITEVEDIYQSNHRLLYRTIRDMYRRGDKIDLKTVSSELGDDLEEAGGISYLVSIFHQVPTVSNAVFYAKHVRAFGAARRAINEIKNAEAELYGARPRDVTPILLKTAGRLSELGETEVGNAPWILLHDAMEEEFGKISSQMKPDAECEAIPTGFPSLDEILMGGLKPGFTYIIAARTSMGKSALALAMATAAAKAGRGSVGFISLEMSASQFALRSIASCARVEARELMRPQDLTLAQWASISNAIDRFSGLPLYICEERQITVGQIRQRCRQLKKEQGLSLVVLDYMQLMASPDNLRVEMVKISQGLRAMAGDLQVPVIGLSQLSRNVERREDKRPVLSDLSESASIEADADVVAFIYRSGYYERKEVPVERRPGDPEVVDEAEIIIAKQRGGPTGVVTLGFVPRFAEFRETSYMKP